MGETEREKRTLEEKRYWAAEGLARWEAKIVLAEAKFETAHEMGGGIPGFGGSGSQRAARQVRSAFSSADRAYSEAVEKLEYYKRKLRYYERTIAERDRKRLGRDDLIGAKLVKTSTGWRKVRKVNTKTVSVDSGYSWADLIPLDKILDYRK